MTQEEMKSWIDEASYETLLRNWRFSPSGNEFLQGEVGDYYSKVMTKKRDENPAAAVTASKNIGWGLNGVKY